MGTPTHLIRGRGIALAELELRLGSAPRRPLMIVVDGAAGSGRSTVLERAAAIARGSGMQILTGTEAVSEATAAANGGVCLVVDDAHRADEASLADLLALMRRSPELPLAVVLSAADGWASPGVSALLDQLRALPDTALIRTDPLAAADGTAIVRDWLGQDAEPGFSALCVEHCGGIPLLLTELLDHLGERGVRGTLEERHEIARCVPERVRATVSARLAELGPEAAAVARGVDVMGSGAPLRHVLSLTGLDRDSAEAGADRLVATRICEASAGLAFGEPIVGAAVAADHEPFKRKRLHRRAAELLTEEGAPVQHIAELLVDTDPAGDSRVVEQLTAAASIASTAREMGAAARYLRRALAEPPAAEERASLVAEHALAESRADNPEAPAIIEAALATTTRPDLRVSLMREQGRQSWLMGRPADAVKFSQRALAEATEGTPVYEEVMTELLGAVSMHDFGTVVEYPILGEVLDRANSGWVPETAGLAGLLTTVLCFALGDHRHVPALVDKALSEDLWPIDATPYGLRPDMVISGLRYADDLTRSMSLIDHGIELCVRSGDAVRLGHYYYWQAEVGYTQGDLGLTLAASRRAIDTALSSPYAGWLGHTTAMLVYLLLDREELAAAAEALDVATPRVEKTELGGIILDESRMPFLVASGKAAEAVELAYDIDARLTALNQRDCPITFWRGGAAEAAYAAGDHELARTWIDAEIAIGRKTHYRGRLGRALWIAAMTREEGRGELLEEAVSVLATTERQLAFAKALLDRGLHLHAEGCLDEARDALGGARELAEECGAGPIAARALRGLHATGARPRRAVRSGPDALTTAERRVVELAAGGQTNRQIADELTLAPRTVEWHLGRAYSKLGVASRRDLAAALGHSTSRTSRVTPQGAPSGTFDDAV